MLVFKYCETGESLDQTHTRGCGISVFVDTLNSTGKVLEQPALINSNLADESRPEVPSNTKTLSLCPIHD